MCAFLKGNFQNLKKKTKIIKIKNPIYPYLLVQLREHNNKLATEPNK